MKFIITAHPDKLRAKKAKIEIEEWLKKNGHEVAPEDQPADLAIVLGGDGYMMHSVTKFSQRRIPSFGINAGDVGFLTNGNISDWKTVMERLIKKDFKIEKRTGLELIYKNKRFGPFANDVYLKHPTSIGYFKVRLNKELVYEDLSSDGLVVSTPTGSTGYNISAGGPIIQPGVSCLTLTPICSGQINARSLVINPDSVVEVEVTSSRDDGGIYLIADGQTIGQLSSGQKIRIKKHSKKLLFAIFNRHDFYRALQEKKGLMK